MNKILNIGISGNGMIVPDFLDAAEKIPEIQVKAIWGRKNSSDKIKKITDKYNIEKTFYEYEKILSDKDIDTIYIAVPNILHFEYAEKALEAGKNVIVEKPFTMRLKEAEILVNKAKEKRLYLFEAITNQYLPNFKKAKELIKTLGKIRIVQLNFSQYSSRYDRFKKGDIAPVFNKELGGGCLGDLNIYNIYFAAGLFGMPVKTQYYPNVQKEVDTSGILIMEYPDFKCVCIAAKDCFGESSISIQGDEGYIKSSSTSNSFSEFSYILRNRDLKQFKLNNNMPRLFYELKEYSRMVLENDYKANEEYMELSLDVMKIYDEAKSFFN